jgi:hypothetical protein
MLQELVSYLIGLQRPITKTIGDFTYGVTDHGIDSEPVIPKARPTLGVVTLSGLVAAHELKLDEQKDVTVHIESHTKVSVVPICADKFGRRTPYVTAVCSEQIPFVFGNYYTPEAFVIAFHSSFVPTDNFYAVVKLLSALSSENSIQTSDDGLTQSVTMNTGTIKRGEVQVKPRVALAPYRTFREAAPVESEFLLRMRGKPGELPTCALIEVDSGKWKIEAILALKHWLDAKLPKGTVVIA